MSDAGAVFKATERKFGKCIIHAISTSDATQLSARLPFNVRHTPQGIAYDGVDRFHIATIEYNDGHVVMIGGHLTEDDHFSIYKLAHELGCDAKALIPFELRAAYSPTNPVGDLESWFRAVRRLEAIGIRISSEGSLVR